jgi:hypothetical protein
VSVRSPGAERGDQTVGAARATLPRAPHPVRYEGERLFDGPQVWVVDDEGRRERLERRVVYHVVPGADWIEWGYGGSGPAELALNLLVDLEGNDRSACARCRGRRYYRGNVCSECGGTGVANELLRLHQAFKWTWIAGLPDHRWTLQADELRTWVEHQLEADKLAAGGLG